MNLTEFNLVSKEKALRELLSCCHSHVWASKLEFLRPFENIAMLQEEANKCWQSLEEKDYFEAFDAHPKIGDKKSVTKKGDAKNWAQDEQSGMKRANPKVRERLSLLNQEYEKKFGFIFLICASGKSADEMLVAISERLANPRKLEFSNAIEEQRKIMQLRIRKLLEG